MGAIRREMNNAKWTFFALLYQTVFAYAASFLIYLQPKPDSDPKDWPGLDQDWQVSLKRKDVEKEEKERKH